LVEVLEYALVVLVSSLVASFSIGVYGGYASAIGPSTNAEAFASVVALARSAIAHGNATATVTLDHAKIGCESRNLKFASPAFSQTSWLPVDCAFPPQDMTGARRLTFEFSTGTLTLQVR
jgi:hypothetical protein